MAQQTSYRQFHYQDSDESVHVKIQELLDPSYGSYIWPSALVLAEYVWKNRLQFANRRIIELGAGTALPSLILAKYFRKKPINLIVTDIAPILPNIKANFELNDIPQSESTLWIRELVWGKFGNHGIDNLLVDVDTQWHNSIDWILGSDTFYDPVDFEKLLMTISYIIHRHNKKAKFITAYQERSSKRSIHLLLDKWSLCCRLIPKESFGFVDARYIQDDESSSDDDDDVPDNSASSMKIRSGALASVFLLEISAAPP
ncbi:putative methyltransferase-domain-containing protein [Umbelopsis sp. PMI_123]|nr:putative methyltransferase-domain-containing protein [Umbelopsis sp. PMI_123]